MDIEYQQEIAQVVSEARTVVETKGLKIDRRRREPMNVESSSEDFDNQSFFSDDGNNTTLRDNELELNQMKESKLCKFCQKAINGSKFDTANLKRPSQEPLEVKDRGVDHMLGWKQGCGLCDLLLRNKSFATLWSQFRWERDGVTTYRGSYGKVLYVQHKSGHSHYISSSSLRIVSSKGLSSWRA